MAPNESRLFEDTERNSRIRFVVDPFNRGSEGRRTDHHPRTAGLAHELAINPADRGEIELVSARRGDELGAVGRGDEQYAAGRTAIAAGATRWMMKRTSALLTPMPNATVATTTRARPVMN